MQQRPAQKWDIENSNLIYPEFRNLCLSPRDVSSPLAGERQEGGGAEGCPLQCGFSALP